MSKNANSYGASIGVSIKGIADIGLTIERIDFKEQILNSELKALAGGPSINLYLSKTDLISVAAFLAYNRVSFSGLQRNDIASLHANSFSLGLSAFHYRESSSLINFSPFVSFTWNTTEIVPKSRSGRIIPRSNLAEDSFLIGSGIVFGLKHRKDNQFILTPAIVIDENGEYSLMISLGYIRKTDGRNKD